MGRAASNDEIVVDHLKAQVRARGAGPAGYEYTCVADFVLRNGRPFVARPMPRRITRGVVGQCFKNATDLALGDRRLTYCEGYAMSQWFPTIHAWCIDHDGVVIDNTWCGSIRKPPRPPLGLAYYGVAFDTEFVMTAILSRGRYGLIENMEQKFPLLKGGQKFQPALSV